MEFKVFFQVISVNGDQITEDICKLHCTKCDVLYSFTDDSHHICLKDAQMIQIHRPVYDIELVVQDGKG